MSQRDKVDGGGGALVAVAVDKEKSSQSAFKWALDNLVLRGESLTLIHVNTKSSNNTLLLFLLLLTHKLFLFYDLVYHLYSPITSVQLDMITLQRCKRKCSSRFDAFAREKK